MRTWIRDNLCNLTIKSDHKTQKTLKCCLVLMWWRLSMSPLHVEVCAKHFSLDKTSPLSIFKASFEEANWPEKYFCKVINMTRARRWWNVNLNLLLRQKKLYPPKWEQNKQIKKAPHKSCNFISLRDFLHQRFRKLDEVNLKYKTILSG